MDSTGTDGPRSPIDQSLVQQPFFQTIHRSVRNCLEIGTSLEPALDDLHDPSLMTMRMESAPPFLDLQDETTLVPFNESDLENPEFLSAAAAEMYRMRRARDHVLPSELTGEPAWDMLLALYSEEHARMTVSSVCYGSGVPQSSALRWIDLLEHKGLVERVEHPRDDQVILLSLTDDGRNLVGPALKAMLRAFRL